MLYEYALDPRLISDRHSARYFFDACKAEKGRLISQFPKRWKRLVYEHCKKVVPHGTSLKYIEERLSKLDGSLIRTGRSFDPERDWVENAIASNKEIPFRAIVSPKAGQGVLSPDVDEDVPEWKISVCVTIQRTADQLADSCAGLLRHAKEVIFIDPYFSGEPRQMRVLKKALSCAIKGQPLKRLEFHVKDRMDAEGFARQLEGVAGQLGDLQTPFYIIRWRDGTETLHDRYILTDRAGVNIAQGLDESTAGDSDTTEISLLGQDSFERRRFQYCANNGGCFEFVDGWVIKNGVIFPVSCVNAEFLPIN